MLSGMKATSQRLRAAQQLKGMTDLHPEVAYSSSSGQPLSMRKHQNTSGEQACSLPEHASTPTTQEQHSSTGGQARTLPSVQAHPPSKSSTAGLMRSSWPTDTRFRSPPARCSSSGSSTLSAGVCVSCVAQQQQRSVAHNARRVLQQPCSMPVVLQQQQGQQQHACSHICAYILTQEGRQECSITHALSMLSIKRHHLYCIGPQGIELCQKEADAQAAQFMYVPRPAARSNVYHKQAGGQKVRRLHTQKERLPARACKRTRTEPARGQPHLTRRA